MVNLIQQGFVEESSQNVKSYGCLGEGSKLGLMIWEQYFKNSEKILWSFLGHYSKQLISFWLIYGTQESQPRMNTQESQRYILKNNFRIYLLSLSAFPNQESCSVSTL